LCQELDIGDGVDFPGAGGFVVGGANDSGGVADVVEQRAGDTDGNGRVVAGIARAGQVVTEEILVLKEAIIARDSRKTSPDRELFAAPAVALVI
jgi:hypothetical protein